MTDALEPRDARPLGPTPEFAIVQGAALATGPSSQLSRDGLFTWLVRLFALATVATLAWMLWVVSQQAWPAIETFGLGFLWGQTWNVGQLVFGGLPYLYGSLVTSTIALVLAVPVGIAVALISSERILPRGLRSPLAFLVELIAAIPSVIVGLWGIFVLIPVLLPVQDFLFKYLGWLPLFSTEPFGPGMLPAGVILAIMVLPTMAAIGREVLLALPRDVQSASGALGATRWETIFRVVLPSATAGLLGAATLALGRALGETMAVIMVIGNSRQISVSLLDLGNTIPALLANEFAEAFEPLHVGALMYLALALLVLTLAVNVVALLLVKAVQQR